MLPSNQEQVIEQAKFTYYPLGKAFEKQTKTIKIKENMKWKQFKFTDKLNQSKNIFMMIKTVDWFQNKNKYLRSLIIKSLKN